MASQQSYGSEGDASRKQVCNRPMTDTSNGCFDCNICLDSSHEPVVTLCGHLYCWPCIYKWLRVQTSSFGSKCPVCKAHISTASLVPLYGRGTSESIKAQLGLKVPGRPPAKLSQQSQDLPHSLGGYTSSASLYSPTINMVGEFVFGSSDTNVSAYPYSNYYHTFSGHGSPRLRRREMQLNRSLNRVSIFMFCCLILCLVLF